MKSRLLPILSLVAFAAVAVFLLGPWRERTPNVVAPSAAGPEPAPAGSGNDVERPRGPQGLVKKQALPPAEPVVMEDMVALANELAKDAGTLEDDLSILQELIRVYTQRVGTVPEGGLNYEIVQGLLGTNRMKLIFIAEDHARINENGELVDRFGTPYEFHPVSSELLEIRSAGPDRQFETPDDVELE